MMKKLLLIIVCITTHHIACIDTSSIPVTSNLTEEITNKQKCVSAINNTLLKALISVVVIMFDDHNKTLTSRAWRSFANCLAAQTIYSALTVPIFASVAPSVPQEKSSGNPFHYNLAKTCDYLVPAIWCSFFASHAYKNDTAAKVVTTGTVIALLNSFSE